MTMEIFCDGAVRNNGSQDPAKPAQGAIGVAIYRNQKMIGQFARGLGKVSNNQAEYEAVIHAIMLAWAADLADPIIYSDSAVVCNQVNGEWDCRAGSLKPLLLTVLELKDVFRFRLEHVPRNIVWEADALANLFLDKMALEEGKQS